MSSFRMTRGEKRKTGTGQVLLPLAILIKFVLLLIIFQISFFLICWSPIGDFRQNFGRQIFFHSPWRLKWSQLGALSCNALQTLGHWLRHVCLNSLSCSFNMQEAFTPDLCTSIWRPDICIWRLFFTNYYLLAPFLKNWPLKKVFRGHFGPQEKFSGWNTEY